MNAYSPLRWYLPAVLSVCMLPMDVMAGAARAPTVRAEAPAIRSVEPEVTARVTPLSAPKAQPMRAEAAPERIPEKRTFAPVKPVHKRTASRTPRAASPVKQVSPEHKLPKKQLSHVFRATERKLDQRSVPQVVPTIHLFEDRSFTGPDAFKMKEGVTLAMNRPNLDPLIHDMVPTMPMSDHGLKEKGMIIVGGKGGPGSSLDEKGIIIINGKDAAGKKGMILVDGHDSLDAELAKKGMIIVGGKAPPGGTPDDQGIIIVDGVVGPDPTVAEHGCLIVDGKDGLGFSPGDKGIIIVDGKKNKLSDSMVEEKGIIVMGSKPGPKRADPLDP